MDYDEAKAQYIADAIRLGYSRYFAETMVNGLWPSVEHVYTETDGTCYFVISSPPLATIASGAICADTNTELHTGEDGVEQTVVIIGKCATIALLGVRIALEEAGIELEGALRFMLTQISPDVSFMRAVRIGSAVIISMKPLTTNRRKVGLVINGWLYESGEQLFVERTLALYRVPDRRN